MTQSELKDQTIDYIKNNLNDQTALEVAQKIIDDLSIELYNNGYISESNDLTTCYLIIKKIIDKN